MDNSFPQQGSNAKQLRGLFAHLQMFDRIPSWLVRVAKLTELTDREQKDAGIYLQQLTEDEQRDAGLDPSE